jgi:hypothetical protein
MTELPIPVVMFQYTLIMDSGFRRGSNQVYTWFDIYPHTKMSNLELIAGDILRDRYGVKRLSFDKEYFASIDEAIASKSGELEIETSAWLSQLVMPPFEGETRFILRL